MRKYEQIRIMDSLRTLNEALDELRKQSDKKVIVSLLADCQSLACEIGNYIEAIEGEGTKTVALLEEYCELLFKASTGDADEKVLRKYLAKVCSKARSELVPNRIEIAFLSYNASMSDSILSIYQAAKKDISCDAYWIPIPYFERNADGSVGKMHYEGQECYPDSECTDWKEYYIEERHPDIIFTFNPYDFNNYVTSVHPDYYCERLCKLTDLLVYVPYFVVADDVPEHFAVTAGCIYAHKVIVQSEKIRDTYVRVFKERFKDSFGKADDKFVALGSPKYDKVISTKREDCILPDAWNELIGNKKVVLYNTSVSPMLSESEQYLKKVRSVIDTFRSRSDVVLWWRPHPLSEAVYKSMRPKLLQEYEKLVTEYKRDGFGIYDDTSELHRAIACTDAYLGDGSSLVSLYSVTGKPVMIQDVDFMSIKKLMNELMFEACYDDGKYIWFATYWFNGLFRCSKETWVAEFKGCFPGEMRNKQRLFSGVVECGGKLYFAPMSAEQVAIYDMATGCFSRIKLRAVDTQMYKFYSDYSKFWYLIPVGRYVYIIPATYPAIVKIDSESYEIEYINDWFANVNQISSFEYWWFGISIGVFNSEIILPMSFADAVLSIDSSTSKTQIISLNTNAMGYAVMCFSGNDFWLSQWCKRDMGAHVVKWDRVSGSIEIIDLSAYGGIADDRETINCFAKMLLLNGKVYALPQHSDTAYSIDEVAKTTEIIDVFSAEFVNSEVLDFIDFVLPCYWACGDIVYALGMKSGTVYLYDTGNKAGCHVELSANMHDAHSNMIIKDVDRCDKLSDCIYYDSDFHNIDIFLDMVACGEILDEVHERQIELAEKEYLLNQGRSGERLYRYCKSLAMK